ncbi:MAG: hypothetical protein JWP89_2872 [Schlesneria sp.]|nr:hypothetical protein [Schlesneria sp.]
MSFIIRLLVKIIARTRQMAHANGIGEYHTIGGEATACDELDDTSSEFSTVSRHDGYSIRWPHMRPWEW